MSKRFGRNQRRRAREALQHATAEAARWEHAYVLCHGLAVSQGQKIHQLERAVDDAKQIAGQMSVLFPAEEFSTDAKPPKHGERFMVDIAERLESMAVEPSITDWQRAEFRRTPLALLVAKIHPGAIEACMHVRVEFADEVRAYGITAAAWQSLTRAQRIDRLRYELSHEFADALASTDLRRYV
jgi:hypothetical protein